MSAEVLFEEHQKVSRTPVIFLPWSIVVISLWALVSRVHAGVPEGQPAASLMSLSLAFVFAAFLLVLFLQFSLLTVVTADRLTIKYTPFHERPIHRADIVSANIVVYDPVRNFGWGCKGRCWTVSGTRAVRIVLRDKEELIIGTRRPEAFVVALEPTTEFRREGA